MNQVTLQGHITRIYRGTKYTVITLFIFGPQRNFPNVSFPTSLIRRYEQENGELQVRDLVRIEASMIAYIKHAQGAGENTEPHDVIYVEQIAKGYKIERVEMTENPEMHRYHNQISLKGTISHVFAEDNVIRLLIKPTGRRFNILVMAYERYPVAFTEAYPPGSTVTLSGVMQTCIKEGAHGVVHFENLVVRQIQKEDTDESVSAMGA